MIATPPEVVFAFQEDKGGKSEKPRGVPAELVPIFQKNNCSKDTSPFHWQELGHNAKQSGKVSILVVHNQPKENWYSASNNEEKNGY